MDWIRRNYKTVGAFVVAALGAIATAIMPGNLEIGDLGARDWVDVSLLVLAAPASVVLISNVPGVAGGVAKAVAAALTGGLGSVKLAMLEESALGSVVTQGEWLGVFIAAIVATGVVYQLTDHDSPPTS